MMRMERLILAAVFVAGCGGSSNHQNDGSASTHDLSVAADDLATTSHPDLGDTDGGSGIGDDGGAPVGSGAIHLTTSTTLGSYLVDGSGRTLYIFGNDVPAGATTPAVSNCVTQCLTFWPVFHVDTVTVSGNLSASDFAEIVRTDGAKQTTYKGWPLYYFASDSAAGQTNGQGLEGTWFVATQPFYTEMVRADSVATHFLSDGGGRSLYVFASDTVGTSTAAPVSACQTAPCATAWPVFTLAPTLAPSTLLGSDFTTLTWTDGTTKQIVYKGHPLYYFKGDAAAPGAVAGRAIAGWSTLDPTT
jgi:predicted lipoprotein with Yx(FWY)xxD motif